jgi:hypothetical protein
LGISEDSEAIGRALPPLSDIGVSLLVPPHARAVLEVIAPLALIGLPVGPAVLPLPMHLPLLVLSLIDAAIAKLFISLPIPEVILPVALIDLSAVIDHDADAFAFVFAVLAIKDGLLVLLETEMGRAVEEGEIDLIGEVGLEVVVQLLVGVAVAVGGGHQGYVH